MICNALARILLVSAFSLATAACQNQDHNQPENSLTVYQGTAALQWNNTWSSSIMLGERDSELDLSSLVATEGALAFDIQVEELTQGDLKLAMHCGDDCRRMVDVSVRARELAGGDWQSVAIPLSCFARPGDTLETISEPFIAEGGGTGKARFANIRFEANSENSVNCLPPELLPVTPAPLTAYWALEWWMPRHEEKLQQAAEGEVELVLIGDSITHGWEDAGKDVWQQHFADYNTLNLGFSGDRTENVLWRFEHGELDGIDPEVAVLMIGTNNAGHRQEPAEFTAKGVATVIEQIKNRLPETQILLLGIFPRGESADDALRELNRETNNYLAEMGQDERVSYLNINDAFLAEDGSLSKEIMPDLLHPNERGYEIWAQAMKPTLTALFAEN